MGNRQPYSAIYGCSPDGEETGYLRINERGPLYSIVGSLGEATLFPRSRPRGAAQWAPPSRWAEFFSVEPELDGWRFHSVSTTRKPS